MRKLVLVLVSAVAAACGSNNDSGTTPGTPLAGTVGGRAFSPLEVRAIPAGSGTTPCPLPLGQTIPAGVKALAIEVTSYADACGTFIGSLGVQCQLHRSSQSVTLLVAKLAPANLLNPNPSEPLLGPGTYTVTASPAQPSPPDATGVLTVAYAQALSPDATCGGTGATPSPSVAGGTIRLDQITATTVTGHAALTFRDGSSLSGDFSATVCANPVSSVCTLIEGALQRPDSPLCSLPPACL